MRCTTQLSLLVSLALYLVPVDHRHAAAVPLSTDTIVIATRPVRAIPPRFFGINYVGFWDSSQGSRGSAHALAQTPIRTVRFAGGAPGDWYDWADPYYKGWSRTSPLDLWRYARALGGNALFQTNYQGHLPHPPGHAYDVNSPQNAAAWVAYDRAHGIGAAMEVGNEEDMGMKRAGDPAFQPYVTLFNAQARAMHRADPKVKVYGPAGTNEYYWWGLDSLGMFLRGAGNRSGSGQVDGVSLHFYKGSTWFDSKGVAQYWLSPTGPWAAIRRIIAAHDTRRLPVYITEWNLGSSDANNTFTPTLGHALATADMLGALAQSGVAGEDYFDIHGASGWGLLYGPGESRAVDSPTPTYYAMALWGHMGDRLLSLQQSDDATSGVSAYATHAANGSYQLLAINKRPTAERLRVLFDGASPGGHRLTAYSLGSTRGSVVDRDATYDGVVMPSPQRSLPAGRRMGAIRNSAISYVVPGYSAVVLSVDRLSPGPRVRERLHVQPPTPLQIKLFGTAAPLTVPTGGTETLTAMVRANQDMGTVLVDLEVYDPAGKKSFQQTQNVVLKAGVLLRVAKRFTVPGHARAGTYHYKIGVFNPNWSGLLSWDDAAGSFSVSG